MPNPAVGAHNIGGQAVGTSTFTTATGFNSAASGSSYLLLVTTNNVAPTLSITSDTYNPVANWTTPTLTTGSNPVQEPISGGYLQALLLVNGAGGSNYQVTVHNGAGSILSVAFVEIQNANTSAPIDVSGSADASASPYYPVNVSVTPVQAGDLIIACAESQTNATAITPGTGSGFTGLDSYAANATALATATLSGASTTTYNAAMTNGTVGGLAGITIAFKAAGGAVTPKPVLSGGKVLVSGGHVVTGALMFMPLRWIMDRRDKLARERKAAGIVIPNQGKISDR